MVDPHDKAYASLVRYGEGVCRAVGIKYGMAHIELKAEFDPNVGRWINPVMIEVGARMAGGRKSVMAEGKPFLSQLAPLLSLLAIVGHCNREIATDNFASLFLNVTSTFHLSNASYGSRMASICCHGVRSHLIESIVRDVAQRIIIPYHFLPSLCFNTTEMPIVDFLCSFLHHSALRNRPFMCLFHQIRMEF